MKKLFISVIALALGAFTFVSCNDDEKINNDDNDGGRFMTVTEQQKAITTALDGIAEAADFSEFSNAIEFVEEIVGSDLELSNIAEALGSPAVAQDSIFQDKMMKAIIMFSQDTIAVDLSPLYMSADLFIFDSLLIDTVRYNGEGGGSGTRIDSTLRTFYILDNIKHDVNYLQLNVFVQEHKVSLKVNVRSGESIIAYKNDNGQKTIYLPKTAEVSLALDDKVLAAINADYTSDMSLSYEDVEGGDDIIDFEGSQFSVSGNLKIVSYTLEGGVKFSKSNGLEANLTAKYSDNALLSVNGKVDAVFDGLDIQDSTAVLVWAQDPEKLKSISLNASLSGGKAEIKGVIENPFKNQELATTLRSLMVPGATISEAKAKETVEQLNGVINAGIYFEGFKQPQARLKFVYREAPEGDKKGKSVMDQVGELFDRAGAYPVLIARDADGNEIEVSFEEYFGGIDASKFVNTLSAKFDDAFGDLIKAIKSNKKK
jgi:hypothetical protein